MKDKIVYGVLIALVSVYLTFIEAVWTLNSVAKYVFVFAYFCVMSILLIWVRKRYLPCAEKRDRFIACVLSVICLIVFQNAFLPLRGNERITLTATHSENGFEGEVWLTQLYVDGKPQSLGTVEVENNDGWTYIAEYQCYVFYPSEEKTENWLTFRIRGEEIQLGLEKNGWSGQVAIQEPSGNLVQYDLESEESEILYHDIYIARHYSLWQRAILNVGAGILMVFVIESVLLMFKKRLPSCR